MKRDWLLPEPVEVPTALREAVGGHPLVARLLAQRGLVDVAQARAYLDPSQYTPASPFALEGMEVARRLLQAALTEGAHVRIWGDFDADGQTSTAVLYEALIALGARVDYRLPRRDEGHGLHPRAIEEALRDGVALLITCDTGIGEAEVVEQGVASGLTIIITDHHDLPPRLPPAQAVIDPNMLPANHPLRELSGVGVAYMVARALLEGTAHASRLEEMLDLVALGLVADVAKQVNDVRYLIQRGLEALRHTRRPGLEALVRAAGLDLAHLSEQDISFQLGPRLNAAGRLADSEMALRLLLTRDVDEAQRLAEWLEALNRDRQARTEAIVAEIQERLKRDPELARKPVIILDGEGWEIGVLGLIATDLARRYDRPAILIAHRQGEPSVASARSVEGIDIHEAILSQREYLVREGGHPMAAGFSIERENIPAFKRGLWDWVSRQAPPRAIPALPIDAEVPWEEISLTLAHELARLAPFGAGNPRPTLVTSGGTLIRIEDVSRERATPHRRLFLDDDSGHPLRFIWFNAGEMPEIGERLDVAFNLYITYWQGKERLQLELVDWQPTARKVKEALSQLLASREVVDWRLAQETERPLLARLRAHYGESLLIWAEALPDLIEQAYSRYELAGRRAPILAILTPPPGPEELRWVLAEVQPQRLYLLPPRELDEPGPTEFLQKVAGMLRVALNQHDGYLDTLRMASRIGARQAAVVAALRGLEALDKVSLRYENGRLRAYWPSEAPPAPETLSEEGDETQVRKQLAQEQAREALLYLLRETRSYRRAYKTLPLAALLATEK